MRLEVFPRSNNAAHAERDENPSREKTARVSAHIPKSLHDEAVDILRRNGFSQTDLIYAAYAFVLERQNLIDSQSVSEHRIEPIPRWEVPQSQPEAPDDREVLTSILTERYFGIPDETE